jgi:hypothetical protein
VRSYAVIHLKKCDEQRWSFRKSGRGLPLQQLLLATPLGPQLTVLLAVLGLQALESHALPEIARASLYQPVHHRQVGGVPLPPWSVLQPPDQDLRVQAPHPGQRSAQTLLYCGSLLKKPLVKSQSSHSRSVDWIPGGGSVMPRCPPEVIAIVSGNLDNHDNLCRCSLTQDLQTSSLTDRSSSYYQYLC